MHHGLLKILNAIANDISNQVLIDRFMGLVSELESEDEKAEYVLKLSSALEEGNPLIAMQFAYMVYQYDRLSVEALQAVVRCLKQLGRYAKAEVLNNELIKIRDLKHRAPTFASREGTKTFSTDLNKSIVDGVEFFSSKEPPSFHEKHHASNATVKVSTLAANVDPLLTTVLPKIPQPPAVHKTKNEAPKPQPLAVASVKAQPAWSGPDLGVVLELFDFYWKHGLLTEAEDLLIGVKNEAQTMPWWKARFAAMQQMNAKKILVPFQSDGEQPSVGEVTSHDGLSEKVRQLIEGKQYRKALFTLSNEVLNLASLEHAAIYYECYVDLCKKLGLSAAVWTSQEGVESLQIKLRQRPQVNLKGAAIRPSRGKKPKAS